MTVVVVKKRKTVAIETMPANEVSKSILNHKKSRRVSLVLSAIDPNDEADGQHILLKDASMENAENQGDSESGHTRDLVQLLCRTLRETSLMSMLQTPRVTFTW